MMSLQASTRYTPPRLCRQCTYYMLEAGTYTRHRPIGSTTVRETWTTGHTRKGVIDFDGELVASRPLHIKATLRAFRKMDDATLCADCMEECTTWIQRSLAARIRERQAAWLKHHQSAFRQKVLSMYDYYVECVAYLGDGDCARPPLNPNSSTTAFEIEFASYTDAISRAHDTENRIRVQRLLQRDQAGLDSDGITYHGEYYQIHVTEMFLHTPEENCEYGRVHPCQPASVDLPTIDEFYACPRICMYETCLHQGGHPTVYGSDIPEETWEEFFGTITHLRPSVDMWNNEVVSALKKVVLFDKPRHVQLNNALQDATKLETQLNELCISTGSLNAQLHLIAAARDKEAELFQGNNFKLPKLVRMLFSLPLRT